MSARVTLSVRQSSVVSRHSAHSVHGKFWRAGPSKGGVVGGSWLEGGIAMGLVVLGWD